MPLRTITRRPSPTQGPAKPRRRLGPASGRGCPPPAGQTQAAILVVAGGQVSCRSIEHPNVAIRLNNLAAMYRAQGRYGEGEPLYRRALAILEKALGSDHLGFAITL